ncbi:MAG: hypothetical protein ACJ8EY_02695 [Sphingomicrobium sp.]
MTKRFLAAAGVSVIAVSAAAFAAAPPPPPIATYWIDAATQSGMGAGMMGGGRPSMSQMMGMMSGRAPQVGHTLYLHLGSRTKAAGEPSAEHLVPQSLGMGASLPLVTPKRAEAARTPTGMPENFERPKGRMLIYWGCGEHVGPNQPTVIDFAKLSAGQVPPQMAQMSRMAQSASGPRQGGPTTFGEWPNERDGKAVPATGSLVGAHKVQGNYSPTIDFNLSQDFMPALGLREAGPLPSGAARLTWQLAPTATGYALGMFGAAQNGDVIMWSSSKSATMAALYDYLSPAEVQRQINAGSVLAPTISECLLPAEVSSAAPQGVITMIGYGPEANFAEAPKAPKWVAKARFKTNASLMRGMGDMGAMNGDASPAPPQPPARKKKKFGIGDVLRNAVPLP